MAAVGGSIQELSVAGRAFAVAADADVNLDLGGYQNETQANGNGTARMVKTFVPWSLDGVQVEIDSDRGDLEYLQGIANRNEFVDVAITMASGVVYSGSGTITGEIKQSTQTASAPLTFGGTGELTKQ